MTPQQTADDIADALLTLLQDLTRIYHLALIVESTEQVEQGTDEWHHREKGKVLFEEGVEIMNRAFDTMRTW